jgi:ADP-ribose pyrophosphatase YjhB (NUDIX family)
MRAAMGSPPDELAHRRANPKLDGIRANVNDVYRDSSGKALTDYPRPSVAVDTAVLTVPDDDPRLSVLLVRRAGVHSGSEWLLPGTFLHEGETLAVAVGRSLREKVGLTPDVAPRQLHVFDDPTRDDRGWVLSVAHVAVLPWTAVEPVVAARPGDVAVRPVSEVSGLPFDHDAIVELAVSRVQADHRERPDPERLLREPFTMRELRHLHEAVAGRRLVPDSFRRHMLPHLQDTGRFAEGVIGRPAALFAKTACS